MLKKIFSFTVIFTFLMTSFVFAGQDFKVAPMYKSTVEVEYVPGEVIVKFMPGISNEEITNFHFNHGTSTIYTSVYGNFMRVKIPDNKTVFEMVKLFSKDLRVKFVEPNYIAYASMIPNDPHYDPYQWHLYNPEYGGIKTETAWDNATGTDVIVAILDTGVGNGRTGDMGEDLAGTKFVAGYDFVDNDSDPGDKPNGGQVSHGTHVCGTIAQTTNNSKGCAGVAFNAKIMPVRVLDGGGSGTYADIADGIHWATDHGAQVINMSLGGSSDSTAMHDAVKYAYNKNVVIVCAAGNDGKEVVSYPAKYAESIAVSATRYDEQIVGYSNYGAEIDLAAPGGDTSIDQNGDGYKDGVLQLTFKHPYSGADEWAYYFFQGTSMATPHVTAVAALVISCGVTDRQKVTNILYNTAEDHGAAGWDKYYGHGIVDAAAAVLEALGGGTPDTTPPVISGVKATDITHNSATIVWTTDEAADSKVEYGLDTSYGSTVTDTAMVTSHSIGLTGLSASTTYHYRVSSTDAAGNTATSADYTFTTNAKPVANTMYVESITFSSVKRGPYRTLYTTVKVVDGAGNPLKGVSVDMTLDYTSGTGSWKFSGTTGADGNVKFTLTKASTGNYKATVTALTLTDYTWDKAKGVTEATYTLN